LPRNRLGLLAFCRAFHYHNAMVLDLIVFGILLASAVVAFMRGFVREVLTIGSLGGAAAGALVFGPAVSPIVHGWLVDPAATQPQQLFGLIPYEMLAPVIAYAIVFVVVLILLTIVTHMISKGVHSVGLGPVDRTLGVVFGLVRGVVLIGLMSLVMNFVLSQSQRQEFFGQSKTYPYINYLADLTNALLPGRDVLDKVHHKGKDKETVAGEDATVGREPLEPGQSAAAKKTGGYSDAERKKLEALIQKPKSTPKAHSQFNN